MGILDRLRTRTDPLTEYLQESIRDLSLALEDKGWRPLGGDDDTFTRDALNIAAQDARTLAVAHPLAKRGLSLRTAYVHGDGGAQITTTTSEVNEVLQEWWADPQTRATVTGPQARTRLERSLATDGNVFITAFTNPRTGRVLLRTIPFTEITEVVTNPQDRAEPWFYRRTTTSGDVLHPALSYAPTRKPATYQGLRVEWSQPVRHVKVNDLEGWAFGIGDLYPVAAYLRGYRDFLTDWMRLTRALSQFAWRATAKGKRASQAAQALARVPAGGGAGSSYVMGPDESLEAVPKTGATIDANSGRPLLAMIAAGLDLPVTMLSSDPGVTGARATAETLTAPMVRAMLARRDVWTAVYIDLAEWVVEQAVRAPEGKLDGRIIRDDWTRTDHAEVAGEKPVITVTWPDLPEGDPLTRVEGLVKAHGTRTLPPEVIARELLTSLSVDNVDDVMAGLTDEDGEYVDPYATLGSQLVRDFQRGGDPAQAMARFTRPDQ